MAALLVTAAVLAGAASVRLHAAVSGARRELREADRRLEPGAGPARRLPDELREHVDVAGAVRDTRWTWSAAATGALAAAVLLLGSWTLTTDPTAPDAAAAVCLMVASCLVPVLLALDGRRSAAALAAAAHRHPLAPLHRLESALAAAARTATRSKRAHEAALRTGAATYPLVGAVARLRTRTSDRAAARHTRALGTLRRIAIAPVDLTAVNVRPPTGYPEGVRGLRALLGSGPLSDDAWAAAVADLARAAELDTARRTRWLSAAAACAELRPDAASRESTARWALESATGPAGTGDDLLPDAVAVAPTDPETWAAALRRARTLDAPPAALGTLVLRWAYALLTPGVRPAEAIDPAVTAAADIMAGLPDPDPFLAIVRPGVERFGATSAQLSRLVPPLPARVARRA